MNKMSVKDLKDLKGKNVLVRCDFNVPMKDGVITDENRITGALPTIKYLLEAGARVTLCSHMGKPHSIFSAEVKLNKKDLKKVDAGETTKEALIEKAKKLFLFFPMESEVFKKNSFAVFQCVAL